MIGLIMTLVFVGALVFAIYAVLERLHIGPEDWT